VNRRGNHAAGELADVTVVGHHGRSNASPHVTGREVPSARRSVPLLGSPELTSHPIELRKPRLPMPKSLALPPAEYYLGKSPARCTFAKWRQKLSTPRSPRCRFCTNNCSCDAPNPVGSDSRRAGLNRELFTETRLCWFTWGTSHAYSSAYRDGLSFSLRVASFLDPDHRRANLHSDRYKVLLADDHCLIAEFCKNLLEPEFDVIGIVSDGQELLRSASELEPDVVLLDISMPTLNGLEAGKKLKEVHPNVKLVYLTMHTSEQFASEALLLGASGYLVKTCCASELKIAIRNALRGECYLSSVISKERVNALIWDRSPARHRKDLSSKEYAVLQLLADGMPMKEVGAVLGLRPRTVAFHKYNIRTILGITSDAEMFAYAVKNNVISSDPCPKIDRMGRLSDSRDPKKLSRRVTDSAGAVQFL
jgi:DNA-binding NarL/FixJ family response regulator